MMSQELCLIAEAELQLAISYLYGEDVHCNKELAIKYLEKSSNKGNKKARLLLGIIEKEDENSIYPEHLKHITANGLKVRSKSEVIIANTLFAQKINFEYEKRLYLSSGIFFVPDFTIYCFNGKKIIWEHLGMLTDDNYLKKWTDKKQEYLNNNFEEGKNLFISIDEKDGRIDSLHILNIAKKIKALSETVSAGVKMSSDDRFENV